MNVPFRLHRYAAVAIAALTLAGCASLTVRSYSAPEFNVTPYRTYNWAPSDAVSTGDPRLDSNPFFQKRLQAAVEKQLAARGIEKTASGTPDLLIHHHESVEQRVAVPAVDRDLGDCRDCRPTIYEAGTLTIDFVDTRTGRLVWRGWAEGAVDGVIDNQEWMEQKIDEAVIRILATCPRR
jgi:Domain of unknown function (DUF4136)